MNRGYVLLLLSTLSIAFVHALAPDHWMPFVALGKAQKWSKTKLGVAAFIGGIFHVGSTILLGSIGILLGFSLSRVTTAESQRDQGALWLLIGFGIAYTLWGLKKAHEHEHKEVDEEITRSRKITLWTLFVIFVLGPCEPLIPLMFLATKYGWDAIFLVCLTFSLVTVFMMMAQSLLGYIGLQLIKHDVAERYSHVLAGLVIVLTGIFVMVFGV